MNTPRDKVAELLAFYFSTVWRAAGLNWDSDNEGEMQDLADEIERLVVAEIQEHAEEAPHIYPDGSQSS